MEIPRSSFWISWKMLLGQECSRVLSLCVPSHLDLKQEAKDGWMERNNANQHLCGKHPLLCRQCCHHVPFIGTSLSKNLPVIKKKNQKWLQKQGRERKNDYKWCGWMRENVNKANGIITVLFFVYFLTFSHWLWLQTCNGEKKKIFEQITTKVVNEIQRNNKEGGRFYQRISIYVNY